MFLALYINFAHDYPLLAMLCLFIVGLSIGSFLNVVIYRLPIMLEREWTAMSKEFLKLDYTPPQRRFNLILPHSTCPQCQTKLKWWHNIPLISYLILKGQCASCKQKISIRYPIIELVTGLLTVLAFIQFGATFQFLAACLFIWILIALTMIDIDTQLLPDNLTQPLLWLGLLANSYNLFVPLTEALYSAVGAYVFLWGFVQLFNLITKKEGMGHGDFKLFAVFGAWFGWQALPMILILSSLAGAIIGIIILKCQDEGKDTPIAFGPYLCAAAFVYLMWGSQLINWYMQWFRL